MPRLFSAAAASQLPCSCHTALGRPYPVTQRPFRTFSKAKDGTTGVIYGKYSLTGEDCIPGGPCGWNHDHDCHYATVKKNEYGEFAPCPHRQEPEADEVVIFNSEQILPRASVQFQRRKKTILFIGPNCQSLLESASENLDSHRQALRLQILLCFSCCVFCVVTPDLFNLHIHSHMLGFSASIRVRNASITSKNGKAASININVVSCDRKYFSTDQECPFNRGDPIIFKSTPSASSAAKSELFGGVKRLNGIGEPQVYWVVDLSADQKKFSISDTQPSFFPDDTADSGVCLPFRSCFRRRRPDVNESKLSLVRFNTIDESTGKEADDGEWMKLIEETDGRPFGMTVEPREYYVSQARNEAKAKSHLEQEIYFQSCRELDMFADYLIKNGHHADNPLLLICCDSEIATDMNRTLKELRVLRFTSLSTDDESYSAAKEFFASRIETSSAASARSDPSLWNVRSVEPACALCANARLYAEEARRCSEEASHAIHQAKTCEDYALTNPFNAEAKQAAAKAAEAAKKAVKQRDDACARAAESPRHGSMSAITCRHHDKKPENKPTVTYFIFDSSRAASAAKTEIESNLATYLKRERPCVSAQACHFKETEHAHSVIASNLQPH